MEQEVATAAAEVVSPHWLEIVAWVATIVLSGTAVLALLYARNQVEQAKRANLGSAAQAKAGILLDLDSRWESNEMQDARKTVRDAKQFVMNKIGEEHQHLDEIARRDKRKEAYCALLFEMRDQRFNAYQDFMRLWGFVETMGYMYERKYLGIEEIEGIFGTVVLQLDDISRLHIQQRDEELSRTMGSPAKLYINFLGLADELRKYD